MGAGMVGCRIGGCGMGDCEDCGDCGADWRGM